jgi:uncharacterized protein Usg
LVKHVERESSDFELQLQGWRLTTAEILYYMPDHPSLIQSFVWQTLDLAPKYPRLTAFLEYWRREIEAMIHSVQIASGQGLAPAMVRQAKDLRFH